MGRRTPSPLVLTILFLFASGSEAACMPACGRLDPRLVEEIRELKERVARLERLLAGRPEEHGLRSGEGKMAPRSPDPAPPQPAAETSVNVALDGYYAYNLNRPAGRANQLRAYDVASNSFSLNQAALVFERQPRPDSGRRWGMRLDLQFGQATETLQGNASNEPRPQVYRHVFQAYGTYVVPVGKGLQFDFGKWASSLGIEGNYTKDQINYSRSHWFNFLPFYHFGFRTSYAPNEKFTLQHWLVNGANQSEDFNGFKSHHFIGVLKPAPSLSWTLGYYVGREQPDSAGAVPRYRRDGRLHIMDSYVSWNAGPRLLFAAEGDLVLHRAARTDPPSRAAGGAAYLRYQLTKALKAGSRFAVFDDRNGLFSGQKQTLKDVTLTATYQPVDGFQAKLEYRRDFSSVRFFLTSTPGVLQKEQNTLLLGLIWWLGAKQGTW